MKYTFVIAALCASVSAIREEDGGISYGSQNIIDSAVSDVLKIASGKAPFEYPVTTSSSTVHHIVPSPYAVSVPYPVAVPIPV